jgi:ATP-dependent protease ClpP protease subunit
MALAANRFLCSYEKVRGAVYEIDNIKKSMKEMNPTIKIRNEADCTTIDIEGTIGLSEQWQFDNPESRVATYERFRESVARIHDISNAHITVNIRSTGGDVNDALLIYEALRATGAHITTRCYGYTASAATIVAQAASEGCREIAPSSLYLIHNSLCSTEGNADELQAEVEMLRQTDERLAEIYASRSGRDIADIAALMSDNGGRGRWLSPAEAIAEGLVDRLITDRGEEHSVEVAARPAEVAKRGVKALLRAMGIEVKEGVPDVCDDINYVSREHNIENSADSSTIAFEEAQRAASPISSELKSVEDPSPIEPQHSSRSVAYERDAQALKQR